MLNTKFLPKFQVELCCFFVVSLICVLLVHVLPSLIFSTWCCRKVNLFRLLSLTRQVLKIFNVIFKLRKTAFFRGASWSFNASLPLMESTLFLKWWVFSMTSPISINSTNYLMLTCLFIDIYWQLSTWRFTSWKYPRSECRPLHNTSTLVFAGFSYFFYLWRFVLLKSLLCYNSNISFFVSFIERTAVLCWL